MTNYNSDFTDLIDTISPNLTNIARSNGLVTFTNGYYDKQNDTYFQGFRFVNKSFPLVFTLKYNFPWHFILYGLSGRTWGSANYNSSQISGGGFLAFTKIFNFELLIDPKLISDKFESFIVEPNEFLNIKSEKFTLDKQELEKNFKRFTQKDIRIIEKWFDSAVKNMIEKVQQPIALQVARRYDEVNAFSEQVAIKYCPQVVKDIFLF